LEKNSVPRKETTRVKESAHQTDEGSENWLVYQSVLWLGAHLVMSSATWTVQKKGFAWALQSAYLTEPRLV
jgi:hypothetical protein